MPFGLHRTGARPGPKCVLCSSARIVKRLAHIGAIPSYLMAWDSYFPGLWVSRGTDGIDSTCPLGTIYGINGN